MNRPEELTDVVSSSKSLISSTHSRAAASELKAAEPSDDLAGNGPRMSAEQWIRIPVILRNGQVSAIDPCGLPELQDGCGQLLVPVNAFKKVAQLEPFRREVLKDVLEAGTILLCRVGWKRVPPSLRSRCKRARLQQSSRDGAFVEVVLTATLKLRVKGSSKAGFEDTQCNIPALELAADSLNEAYRKISEKFEPDRRSFGGSVFQNIYAFVPGKREWVPLDDLRSIVVSAMSVEPPSIPDV